MKIIDERGRLFGKINLIDFLVILLLFSFIPMVYFGYKLFSVSKSRVPSATISTTSKEVSLDFYGIIKNLSSEEIKFISVGDRCLEKDKVIAEILAISTPEINIDSVDLGDGKTLLINDPLQRQIFIKVRLFGELKDNIFYYQGEKIGIGTKIPFNTEKYNVYLIIESIGGAKEREVTHRLKKQYKGIVFPQLEPVGLNILVKPLDLDTIQSVSVGDNLVDESGNNIGTILDVGVPSIYSYAIDLGQGNILNRDDPSRRQLPIKVRLLGQIKDNLFYYRGEKVTLGSKIVIKTDKYQVEGIIESEPKLIYRENILLKVRFENLMPEVANFIKVGDEGKNEEGETIAVIKSILANQPSRVLIQDGKQMIFTEHPLNRDATLFIEVNSIKVGNKLLFKKNMPKIGGTVLFSSEAYDIKGTIIWINENN